MYWIGIGTDAAVLNSLAVPISQVVLKTGFTVVAKSLNFLSVRENQHFFGGRGIHLTRIQ